MKDTETQKLAKIIQSKVNFFNGWWVDEKTEREACEKAARAVLSSLRVRKKLKPKN